MHVSCYVLYTFKLAQLFLGQYTRHQGIIGTSTLVFQQAPCVGFIMSQSKMSVSVPPLTHSLPNQSPFIRFVLWMLPFLRITRKAEQMFLLTDTLVTSMKVKVAQSCLTLCSPMDYTVHGILQARILEWVAVHFSRGSSQPRDRTQASRIADGFFTS